MDLTGRLSSFPVPDLLQWAETESCTGALVVRRSHREKRLYFQDGEVTACLSDDPAEYFGRYLILNDHLEKRELVEALQHCRQHTCRLGEAIVEIGLMRPHEVRQTLRRHIEDSVCDLFLWPRGVFFYLEERAPEEDLLPAPISTMGLALEGARWHDEYKRLRRVFVHDNIVLFRGQGQATWSLSPLEARVLAAVDGELTLGQLYKTLQGSYYRFLEAAFGLTMVEVLEIGDVGDTDPAESSRELGVYDLLLEQAAQEEGMLLRPTISLELLERFYPVWVEQPKQDEEIPPRVQAFRARIDGRTSIKELLSREDREDRTADLLAVELRQGLLALLPKPLPEIDEGSEDKPPWWRHFMPSRD